MQHGQVRSGHLYSIQFVLRSNQPSSYNFILCSILSVERYTIFSFLFCESEIVLLGNCIPFFRPITFIFRFQPTTEGKCLSRSMLFKVNQQIFNYLF